HRRLHSFATRRSSDLDVQVYAGPEQVREALVRQLYSPVRWTETVRWLAKQGVGRIVEAGPGKVLTGLARRIDGSLAAACIDSPATLDELLASRPEDSD